MTIWMGRRSRKHYEDQEEERRGNTRTRDVIWTLRKEKKRKQKNNGKEEHDNKFDGKQTEKSGGKSNKIRLFMEKNKMGNRRLIMGRTRRIRTIEEERKEEQGNNKGKEEKDNNNKSRKDVLNKLKHVSFCKPSLQKSNFLITWA
jgi:hypothetical protein